MGDHREQRAIKLFQTVCKHVHVTLLVRWSQLWIRKDACACHTDWSSRFWINLGARPCKFSRGKLLKCLFQWKTIVYKLLLLWFGLTLYRQPFEMNGGCTKTMLTLRHEHLHQIKKQKSSLKSKLIAKNQGNRIQNDSAFQNLSLGGPVSPPSLGHSNEPPRWTHKGQYVTPQKELCKKWEPWTFMPTAKFLKNGHYKIYKIKIPTNSRLNKNITGTKWRSQHQAIRT